MRLHAALLLFTALGLAAVPAQAQWKWKDANGQVHVSDLPPPRDVPDKDVLKRPDPGQRRSGPAAAPAASAASAATRLPVDPELEARRQRAEQEQKAKSKAEDEKQAAQRAENCRRARQHLAALESGQRIARLNDKGEREILDDKARADEMQQAQQVIASECR